MNNRDRGKGLHYLIIDYDRYWSLEVILLLTVTFYAIPERSACMWRPKPIDTPSLVEIVR